MRIYLKNSEIWKKLVQNWKRIEKGVPYTRLFYLPIAESSQASHTNNLSLHAKQVKGIHQIPQFADSYEKKSASHLNTRELCCNFDGQSVVKLGKLKFL